MSVPGNYVPPPPPPASGSGGCFKWGGIACGGCALLIVIVIVIGFVATPKSVKSFFGQSFALGLNSQRAIIEEKHLMTQIEKYRSDTGKYPNKLTDLVPKYVTSESQLHLSTIPAGPEFTYNKPTADSGDDFVVLDYKLTLTGPDGKTITQSVGTAKSGHVVQRTETPVPNERSSGSGQ